MEKRKLGRSDIEVSAIAMGCWAIAGGDLWGDQSTPDALAAVRTALDAGMNTFDTAEAYGAGRSEELLGQGLAGRRHEAVIATKAGPSHITSDELPKACEASLKRLKTDYIDLYQMHWPNHDVPIEQSLGALQKLQDQGKIRGIGVSNFGTQDLSGLLAKGRCEANQMNYSLLTRAIEFGVQDFCAQNDISIFCYSPLAQGLLTGKYASIDDVPLVRRRTRHFSPRHGQAHHHESGCEEQVFEALGKIRAICDGLGRPMTHVALAWLLAQKGVACVLAGARDPEQVRQNAAAAGVKLDQNVIDQLTQATEQVKQALGPSADIYSTESRIR